MSAERTRLLLRDRAELDKIAVLFRGGRTVTAFIICPASLRPAVLDYLRTFGQTWVIPDPFEPADAAQMHSWLVEAKAKAPREIVTVVIPQAGGPVMNALNLHREKLREGASKLIFIADAEGMANLRSQGRDAYTFRDVAAYLMGEAPVPPVLPTEESVELTDARDAYRRATWKQGEAAWAFARQLRRREDLAPAERVLRQALAQFEDDWLKEEDFADLYARLSYVLGTVLSARAKSTEVFLWVMRGMRYLQALEMPQRQRMRPYLSSIIPGPYGKNTELLRREITNGDATSSLQVPQVSISLAQFYWQFGNVQEAHRNLLRAETLTSNSPFNSAAVRAISSSLTLSRGRFEDAEAIAREAAAMFVESGASALAAHETLAESLFLRGETEAATRVLESILRSSTDRIRVASSRIRLAQIAVAIGDIEEGTNALQTLANEALDAGADRAHYDAHASLVGCLLDLHEAGRLSPEDMTRAIHDLENAEELSRVAFGIDPPWYTIFFPLRRSELLVLRPDFLSDAITLAQDALDRARASCAEMIPEAARVYGRHLIRAEKFDAALESLSIAESAGQHEEQLREVASARGWGIVAAVRAGKPAGEIEMRLGALRETLAASDSPRLEAEQLLNLGRALPAWSSLPDPLVLLEGAQDLFAAMPYPLLEACCMETAGDVLTARSDRDGAARRYRAALTVLERRGLRLRAPVVETKLQGA